MDTEMERQQETIQEQRAIGRTQCGSCKRYFAGASAFDIHRTGRFSDPIYEPRKTGKGERIVGYTQHARRCMDEQEMQATGLASERRRVRWLVEGKDHAEECDVWYDIAGRERAARNLHGDVPRE